MAMAAAAGGERGGFKLWPPSDATRATLVERMATNLTSMSFFSQKYGRIDSTEAGEHAKQIEEAAFAVAQKEAEAQQDGFGSSTVQVYARHASYLMLERLKIGKREGAPVSLVSIQGSEGHEQDGTDGSAGDGEQPGRVERSVSDGQEEGTEKIIFDVSGGTRTFLEKETAEDLLRPLLQADEAYNHICLSNRSFGIEAAAVAARALRPLRDQLVDVNLADIVAGRPEGEALRVMSSFSAALEGCQLRSLNLSDNALGEKGVRAFAALLKSQSSLQALYFMNNGISEDAARAIRELLPSAQKILTLQFHNNMTGDAGAQELAEIVRTAPLIEDFQFSSTRVGSEGGIALAKALQSGRCLRRIDLRDNMYGPEGGLALAETLRIHTQLREAYLSDLGLEDKGTLAVAKALAEGASQLAVLELGGNEITVNAAPALATCIQSMKFLSRLNLSENELEDKGAVVVCQALGEGHECLKSLDLSMNELSRIGAVAAAQAVAGKPGFVSLNLNGNHISEAGIEALQEVLAKGVVGIGVLGSLDENEEEDEEDEEEDKESGSEPEDGDDDLAAEIQDLTM